MQLSVSFQHRTKRKDKQLQRGVHNLCENNHAQKALIPCLQKLNKQGPEMNTSTSQSQLHPVSPAMNFQWTLYSPHTPTICNLHYKMHPTPASKRKETAVTAQYIFHSVFHQHPEGQLTTTNKPAIWVLCRRGGCEELLVHKFLKCCCLTALSCSPAGQSHLKYQGSPDAFPLGMHNMHVQISTHTELCSIYCQTLPVPTPVCLAEVLCVMCHVGSLCSQRHWQEQA